MKTVLHGRRPSRWALDALLLMATLSVIGCSSKPAPTRNDLAVESQNTARATILENVEDGARRDRVLELADQLAATEINYLKNQDALMGDLLELNEDYDSERDSFTSTYGSLGILRSETAEELLGSLAALEQLLDPDEWNALVDSLNRTQGAWSEAQ